MVVFLGDGEITGAGEHAILTSQVPQKLQSSTGARSETRLGNLFPVGYRLDQALRAT